MSMGQPDDPLTNTSSRRGGLTCGSRRLWIGGRGRPLNVRRLEVVVHHRTTGLPGQGVDGRLLCPVINKPGPNPPLGGPYVLRLRQKVFGCERMNSSGADEPSNPQQTETRLVTAGRDATTQKGFVNPAVFHGSTVLYPTAEDLHAHRGEFQYGRHGTPTTRALQEALMALEGPQCAGVGIAPSGLSAITTTLLAVTRSSEWKAAIAVAPVTDRAYYDTKYVETFMKTPEENPEGYEYVSLVKRAKDLHGRLLLVHGTYDDNVHPQNTWHFADELVKAGKPFDMMIYPMRKHGIEDRAARRHLFNKMLEFWKLYL